VRLAARHVRERANAVVPSPTLRSLQVSRPCGTLVARARLMFIDPVYARNASIDAPPVNPNPEPLAASMPAPFRDPPLNPPDPKDPPAPSGPEPSAPDEPGVPDESIPDGPDPSPLDA
jgi:hypothetical protein